MILSDIQNKIDICIANETNTNLEECLEFVLKKYEKRFLDKGDLGSGR